jgi:hypothetical protein
MSDSEYMEVASQAQGNPSQKNVAHFVLDVSLASTPMKSKA